MTRGLWVVELVKKIGHKYKIMWYSVIVVDIDQGGCVELTRGRCKTLWGRLGIDELDLHTTKAYNQPRHTTKAAPICGHRHHDIADITFLYVNVMLSASQLHFFGYLLCTLYFSRLDGKDQLQYS